MLEGLQNILFGWITQIRNKSKSMTSLLKTWRFVNHLEGMSDDVQPQH